MSPPKQLEYDAAILQEFAKRLYRQADNTVGRWVAIGLFSGLAGGTLLSNFLHLPPDRALWITGGLTLFLVFICYSIGSDRAFKFRLEAQHVLCQVAIERNTRLAGRVEPLAQVRKPADEERAPQRATNGHGVFLR